MSEKWYVYRHSLELPILKADETELILTPGGASWTAQFNLKGGTVDVEMVAEEATDAWHGKVKGLEFRWSVIGKYLYAGQIVDPGNANKSRDFFIATKSQTTSPIPPLDTYRFTGSCLTPIERLKASEAAGGMIVDRSAKTMTLKGINYGITSDDPHGKGRKLIGWYDSDGASPQSLELWVFPVDATGRLLATGCTSHWPPGMPLRPFDPDCVIGVHGI